MIAKRIAEEFPLAVNGFINHLALWPDRRDRRFGQRPANQPCWMAANHLCSGFGGQRAPGEIYVVAKCISDPGSSAANISSPVARSDVSNAAVERLQPALCPNFDSGP